MSETDVVELLFKSLDGLKPPFADGVYFDLNEDLYHSDEALGSSSLRDLFKNPEEYWWRSSMNPTRKVKESDAMTWGSAFHSLILDGRTAFDKLYAREPAKEDFDKDLLMITANDLKKWLKDRQLKVSGNKDELIARILDFDKEALIFDHILEKATEMAGDRTMLKARDYESIILSSDMIVKNPHLAGAFTGGISEVSIFYTRPDGVRCKCRIDYLKPKANVDLKSLRNFMDREYDDAVRLSIKSRRYEMQAAHYSELRRHLPRFYENNQIFGEYDVELFEQIVAEDDFDWFWVFYQAEGAPIAKGYRFTSQHRTYADSLNDVEEAIKSYRQRMDIFGREIWVNMDPIRTIDDEEISIFRRHR